MAYLLGRTARVALALLFALLPALLPVGAARAQASGAELDAELAACLARARASLESPGSSWREVSGETQHVGLPARFRLTLGPGGRFLHELDGRASQSTGFDGSETWRVDGRSPAYPLVLLHRERALATTFVWSGAWALADSPFEFLRLEPRGEETGPVLELKLREGLLRARLALDPVSSLPERLEFPEGFGGGALRFADWRSGAGGRLPWRIEWREAEGEPVVYCTTRVSALEAGGDSARFRAPTGAGTDTHFARELPARLELRQAGRGHFFVRPEVNGRTIGWFLFDSGAGATIITRAAADELELPSFGEVSVSGMGGPPRTRPLRQSERLRLGPLTIEGLALSETDDMGMADDMLGEPCAGALGWDVFLRAVVEIDALEPSVALHDPALYANTTGLWEALILHWKVPYVRARFEGEREGLFCIDTGAGGTGVLFHALAARELKLLDGRDAESLSGRGAGGSFEMRSIELAWFEVAGNRVEPAPALLALGDDGEADPYALGFLGSGFLGPYRLCFDYSRRHMGFLPR